MIRAMLPAFKDNRPAGYSTGQDSIPISTGENQNLTVLNQDASGLTKDSNTILISLVFLNR